MRPQLSLTQLNNFFSSVDSILKWPLISPFFSAPSFLCYIVILWSSRPVSPSSCWFELSWWQSCWQLRVLLWIEMSNLTDYPGLSIHLHPIYFLVLKVIQFSEYNTPVLHFICGPSLGYVIPAVYLLLPHFVPGILVKILSSIWKPIFKNHYY